VIRVLVADDHAFVRGALCHRLSQDADIEVVAACADGDEVLAAALRTHPDVAVLDLTMARVGGLEATGQLGRALPAVRVLVLTARLDPAAVRTAYELGAAGYVLKDGDPDALTGYVRRVAAGGSAWTGAAQAMTGEAQTLACQHSSDCAE
jgi:two-component system response regulator DesR